MNVKCIMKSILSFPSQDGLCSCFDDKISVGLYYSTCDLLKCVYPYFFICLICQSFLVLKKLWVRRHSLASFLMYKLLPSKFPLRESQAICLPQENTNRYSSIDCFNTYIAFIYIYCNTQKHAKENKT